MDNDPDPRPARRRAALDIAFVGVGFASGGGLGFLSGWETGGLMVGTLVGGAMGLGGALVATAVVGFRAAATSLAVLVRPRDDATAGDYDDRLPKP